MKYKSIRVHYVASLVREVDGCVVDTDDNDDDDNNDDNDNNNDDRREGEGRKV